MYNGSHGDFQSTGLKGEHMRMTSGLQYWTPDECAECLPGISKSLYARLWQLLGEIKKKDRVPLGGDGSNGTIEFPPEPDAYAPGKMGACGTS